MVIILVLGIVFYIFTILVTFVIGSLVVIKESIFQGLWMVLFLIINIVLVFWGYQAINKGISKKTIESTNIAYFTEADDPVEAFFKAANEQLTDGFDHKYVRLNVLRESSIAGYDSETGQILNYSEIAGVNEFDANESYFDDCVVVKGPKNYIWEIEADYTFSELFYQIKKYKDPNYPTYSITLISLTDEYYSDNKSEIVEKIKTMPKSDIQETIEQKAYGYFISLGNGSVLKSQKYKKDFWWAWIVRVFLRLVFIAAMGFLFYLPGTLIKDKHVGEMSIFGKYYVALRKAVCLMLLTFAIFLFLKPLDRKPLVKFEAIETHPINSASTNAGGEFYSIEFADTLSAVPLEVDAQQVYPLSDAPTTVTKMRIKPANLWEFIWPLKGTYGTVYVLE